MRRETALVLSIAGLFAAMLLVAVIAPGALAETESESVTEDEVPSSQLRLTDVTMAPDAVRGETATLSINLHLRHEGATSENVDVVLRATNADTGLVANRTELAVSDIEGDRDLAVSGSITLERDSDYELETLIYENETLEATGDARLSGLDGLEPDYADAPLNFHRFTATDLPAVAYSVDRAGDEADLDVSAYVTNRGDGTAGNVEVELIARQTDSKIVADQERVRVGQVDPGQTMTPETTLTVPDEYNYYLDAVIWRDGVIVDTVREAATLAPNVTAPDTDESTSAEDAVELDDFDTEQEETGDTGGDAGGDVGGDDAGDDVGDDRGDGAGGGDGQPGFGSLAAVLALILGTLAAARLVSTNDTTDSDQ